jgi:hypothetical protein
MKWNDFFFDEEAFNLQAATVSFLKKQWQELDEFLVECCVNECDEDWFKLKMRYPEWCAEADRLDKRIKIEWERLRKLASQK